MSIRFDITATSIRQPLAGGNGDACCARRSGMKALGVIAGRMAGLSAAKAGEKDDLVSIFKAACMSEKPFVESLRDFAQSRGWDYKVGPSREIGRNGEVIAEHISASAFPPNFRFRKTSIVLFASAGVKFEGQVLDKCTASEDGLKRARLSSRVDSVLKLPGSPQQVSPTSALRRYFGKEGPDEKSKQWSLASDKWDYVIFYETMHMGPHTTLTRIKSSN